MSKVDYLLFLSNKIDTGSRYQQIPLSAEDNVFAAEEDEIGNEQNDYNVINAKDIEFGDNDGSNSTNETATIDEGWFRKNNFIVLNSTMLIVFSL